MYLFSIVGEMKTCRYALMNSSGRCYNGHLPLTSKLTLPNFSPTAHGCFPTPVMWLTLKEIGESPYGKCAGHPTAVSKSDKDITL